MINTLSQATETITAILAEREPHAPERLHPSYQRFIDGVQDFRQAIEDHHPPETDLTSDPDWLAAANDLLTRPVFVGGIMRSGTTLFRNLLDGHPALSVFPAEGVMFSVISKNAHLPHADLAEIILRAAFQRLISTNLGRGPHFFLGNGTPDPSPYYRYISSYRAMVTRLPETPISLMKASMIAHLAACNLSTEAIRAKRYWVEKSPSNLRDIAPLRESFPDARFLICLRDPRAVVNSSRFRHLQKYGNFDLQGLSEMIAGRWDILAKQQRLDGGETILALHYEDFAQETAPVMQEVADFLDMPFDEATLTPSIGGLPVVANTAFATGAIEGDQVFKASIERWRKKLSPAEIAYTTAVLARRMERFGYRGEEAVGLTGYLRTVWQLKREYTEDGLRFSVRRGLRHWRDR